MYYLLKKEKEEEEMNKGKRSELEKIQLLCDCLDKSLVSSILGGSFAIHDIAKPIMPSDSVIRSDGD